MSMKLLLETWKAYTQELLTEKKMEQVEIRFQSKNFLKAVEQFNEEETESMTRFGFGGASQPKSPQKIQERLTNQIPADIKEKDKAEALDWMITSFINTKDIDFYSKDIELFYQIKEAKQDRILSKNSIYSIKDSIELHEIVEAAKPAWEAYNQSRADKDSEAGSNKIYEDENWTVYVPENKGAACKLGKDTQWCTAAPGLEYYRQYHKEDDPLIIFISKQNPLEKYQFHYGSKQFMDKDDRNIDQTTTWFELNSIVANMPNPRISDDIKEQAAENSEGFEKLPNGGYKITNGYNTYYYDKNQNLHREDGPAFIDFDYDKNPLHEHWYIHGKKGRIDDGPAETEYYSNGKPKRQKWFTSGSLGREDDKPTIISYDESGKITQKEWLDTDGIRNRKNGPALIRADGTKVWYYNGDKHRFDGPAWESPDEIAYFWMGNRVSKEEYEERLYAYENIPFEESLQRIIKEELVNVLQEKWSAKYKRSIDCKHPKGFSQRAHCQGRKKNEGNDPKVGTGKKPEGSGRRLYTDENPSDTVSVKFSTVQDIKDTLSKESFKSKSHARQSQIINLIHQRVRAAYQNAKDPEVKARLKKAYEYAEQRKEASKEKTARLQKEEQSIQLNEKCWKGYTQKGMKTMFGKEYPNCVKKTDEEMELEEKRKLGKPSSETNLGDWFKRKGAPGKKGGWVDCNTCRDGKCKPCGRQSGEKRSKYPRCRPTPSQCKGYKRRGSNLQKEE